MKSAMAMKTRIEPTHEEKEIRLPSPHTAEGIVARLILNSHFTASIKSIREMRNGETIYRVILTKREGR